MLVGEHARAFIAHTDLLASRSTFFAASLLRWQEGQERSLKLAQIDPDLFGVYVHGVYTQTLSAAFAAQSNTEGEEPSYLSHAKIWILGDVLKDRAFQNEIIDHTLEFMLRDQRAVHPSTIKYITDSAVNGSALPRLHCAFAMARCDEVYDLGQGGLPELVRDCTDLFLGGKVNVKKGLLWKDRCKNHVHADGEEKCKQAGPEIQPPVYLWRGLVLYTCLGDEHTIASPSLSTTMVADGVLVRRVAACHYAVSNPSERFKVAALTAIARLQISYWSMRNVNFS